MPALRGSTAVAGLVLLAVFACGTPSPAPRARSTPSPLVAPTPATYERSSLFGRLVAMSSAIHALRQGGGKIIFRDSSARGHFIQLTGPQERGADDLDLEVPTTGYVVDRDATAVIAQSGLRQPNAQHQALWRDQVDFEDHQVANLCEQVFRRVFKSPMDYAVVVEKV